MYCYEYPRAAITADIIVLNKQKTHILLIKRKNEPFKNKWAFPGGFMDMNETIEQTAKRELQEETSINCNEYKQFRVYSEVNRDPRHRTLTVCFYCFVDNAATNAEAGDDASEIQWFKLNNLPELAFDHNTILNDFINEKLF